MAIPFYLQYYVEKERSDRFQWMNYVILIGSLVVYGIFLHWIPMYLRSRRDAASLTNKKYFTFIKWVDLFNSTFHFTIPIVKKTVYYQPSLLFVFTIFMAINGIFCFVQTKDIDYLPRQYVIAKRIGKVALGNFPAIYLLIIKNDFLTAITGFQHDRLVLIHKWLARMIFVMTAFHIGYCARYWLHLGFPIMLIIPPQIFGYIATVCFAGLTFGSAKFIRKFAYDAFLIEHRVFSFIFLLMVFFHHRTSTTGAIVLAVHQLVLDRIVSRVLSIVHSRMSPTKGRSTFEILDDETILVSVPIKAFPFHERKKWMIPLPKLNTWKAGQHIYLTVGKISRMQMHPFTIASLSESGEMKFVIRVQKGFTKKLKNRILKLKQEKEEAQREESDGSLESSESGADRFTNSSSFDVETELITNTNTHKKKKKTNTTDDINEIENDGEETIMKASIYGPVGARYLPLITFDSVLFFCSGSGASFCFPVALDLLQTMEKRNFKQDYLNRNPDETVRIVWAIKQTANIAWFKFVLDELVPYCNKGMLTLDVHLTQEKTIPTLGSSVQKETIAVEGTSREYDITVEKSHPNSITKKDSYTSISSSVDAYDAKNLYYHIGRPDADLIITRHVDELKDTSNLKSLAVLSCGQGKFTHAIKDSCQKNKWVTNAPNIYCYTESFD